MGVSLNFERSKMRTPRACCVRRQKVGTKEEKKRKKDRGRSADNRAERRDAKDVVVDAIKV
jgi:hypothetical protein